MNTVTRNEKETRNLGIEFAKRIKAGDIVLFYGDLGAGKTTFIQGIADGLGVGDKILSPTFVLIRSHDVDLGDIKVMNHIDLYRLESASEIDTLGLGEMLEDPSSVTLIEWADKLSSFSLKRGFKILMMHKGRDSREIQIEEVNG